MRNAEEAGGTCVFTVGILSVNVSCALSCLNATDRLQYYLKYAVYLLHLRYNGTASTNIKERLVGGVNNNFYVVFNMVLTEEEKKRLCD